MLCEKCKQEIPDGSAVCPHCNAAVGAPPEPPPSPGTADAGPEQPASPRPAALFCQNCGAPLPQRAKFCSACGTKTDNGPAQPLYTPPAPPAPDGPAYPYPQVPYAPPRPTTGATPARNVLWTMCTSPLALVAAITYSLSVLLSLFNVLAFNSSSSIWNLIMSRIPYYDFDMDFYHMYQIFRGTYTSSAIIGMVPVILIAIGLWLIYASAAQRGVRTSGLTIIKVILIIQFVAVCIILFIALAVLVIAGAAMAGYDEVVAVIIGAVIVVAALAVLLILYFVKAVQTVNTIRGTFLFGNPSDRVSAYVAVLTFISAGFTVITAFFSTGALSTLSSLCSAAASICFGIFLFSYRGKMRSL